VKNKKGITLIELVIAMALLGIVIAMSFSMISFGNIVVKKVSDEFDVQSSTRLVTEYTNRIARYSTAAYTIPKSSFTEEKLDPKWNYVGTIDGSVVQYEVNLAGGGHTKTVLAEATDTVYYEVIFKKAAADYFDKIVSFSIQGFIKDRPVEYDAYGNKIGHIDIVSQTESLNSLQVIHNGTYADPAVALAYRSDDRSDPQRPAAYVSMVLDMSGSMNDKMNGDPTNNTESKRVFFLKNSLRSLVNQFSVSEYSSNISLVPFSDAANNPKPMIDVTTASGKQSVLNLINGLTVDGGTNTGDGIRRAYYQLFDSRNPDEITREYIIILVDGVTTAHTRTGINAPSSPYWTANGNVVISQWYTPYWGNSYYRNGNIYGLGNAASAESDGYVVRSGQTIKNEFSDGQQRIKTFVIGFSSDSDDFGSLNAISDAVNATGYTDDSGSYHKYFTAGDEDDLNQIFNSLHGLILSDLFHIDGPVLG
jgi:prepilin-type N-terminal cleavage/methylation domain-containing protein